MPPLPKSPETRRRRNHGPSLTYLPAEGRKGRTPKWPLDELRDGEAALWRIVWKSPEAVLWEREQAYRLVARYVRVAVMAESATGDGARYHWNEARALEDRLLLSPKAKAMAKVAVREPAEVVAGPGAPSSATAERGPTPAERLAAAAS